MGWLCKPFGAFYAFLFGEFDMSFRTAMCKAAAHIMGSELTEAQETELFQDFDRATGTKQERVKKALGDFTDTTQEKLRENRTASDDLDRILNDIDSALKDQER